MAQPSSFASQIPALLVEICVEPADTTFTTVSNAEDARMDVWDELSESSDYHIQVGSEEQTRDAGIILLLGEVAREVLSHQDLVKALFQAAATTISAVAKRRQVKKIEMTLEGDSISIEEPDTITVQRLLNIYETRHPGKIATLPSSAIIQIKGIATK